MRWSPSTTRVKAATDAISHAISDLVSKLSRTAVLANRETKNTNQQRPTLPPTPRHDLAHRLVRPMATERPHSLVVIRIFRLAHGNATREDRLKVGPCPVRRQVAQYHRIIL